MRRRSATCLAGLLWLAGVAAAQQPSTAPGPAVPLEPANLVLLNARVWTLDEAQPEAEAVAIRGNRIVKVGTTEEVKELVGKDFTRVLNLHGRLVLPGFIDNHTHFAAAGRLLLGLNLLEVNERAAFVARVRAAAGRLPKGSWITGGDWGAYAQWQRGAAGASRARVTLLEPHKNWIDPVTPEHPALIRRFDGRVWLANSLALAAAGITRETPDPPEGEIARDGNGEPTGLLRGAAAELVQRAIPPPSHEQRLAEGRRALEEARRWGVTSIQDNTSFEQLELFKEFRKQDELTLRVWARTPLAEWERLKEYLRLYRVPAGRGVWGDQYIRLGGLKGW
ncbi:MAG: amidohydrolase family protein, partial [Terriglobia bacterium]